MSKKDIPVEFIEIVPVNILSHCLGGSLSSAEPVTPTYMLPSFSSSSTEVERVAPIVGNFSQAPPQGGESTPIFNPQIIGD